MIHTIAMLAVMAAPLASCSDDDVRLEQKDWAGTANLFLSTDEKGQDTYYKPVAGYVGDPMPFYDPVAQNFKVMYLQDYRPNAVGTYHPICVWKRKMPRTMSRWVS